jgi:hypothetical protein
MMETLPLSDVFELFNFLTLECIHVEQIIGMSSLGSLQTVLLLSLLESFWADQ